MREEGGKGGEGIGEWREEEGEDRGRGEDRGKGMEGKGRREREGGEGEEGKGGGREEGICNHASLGLVQAHPNKNPLQYS